MGKTFLRIFAFPAILTISSFASAAETIQADIKPPLGSGDFYQLISKVLAKLSPVVVTVAVVMIIFVGFKYVMAAGSGNVGEIKKQNTNLMYVLIGTAVIVGASLIASAVINTINSL